MRGLIRFLGRMVLVAVAAILIGGGLAAPAAAKPRSYGVREANDFIAWCVAAGGTPVVTRADEVSIDVTCTLPDGTIVNCYWGEGDTDGPWTGGCLTTRPVPGGLPTLGPGTLHPVEAVDEAPVGPPAAAAPADNQNDEQVNEPKKKKKKQAKKGEDKDKAKHAKKGKDKDKAKHAKPKPRGKGRGGR